MIKGNLFYGFRAVFPRFPGQGELPWQNANRNTATNDAVEASAAAVRLPDAEGKISGTYVNLYPPGIPLIIPGEVITEEIIKLIDRYVQLGLNVQGVERPDGGGLSAMELTIKVIKGWRS